VVLVGGQADLDRRQAAEAQSGQLMAESLVEEVDASSHRRPRERDM
jgi:hypothetical protein